jgi:hypothetical protein
MTVCRSLVTVKSTFLRNNASDLPKKPQTQKNIYLILLANYPAWSSPATGGKGIFLALREGRESLMEFSQFDKNGS